MVRLLSFIFILAFQHAAVCYADISEIFAVQIGSYKYFAEKYKNEASQFGVVHTFTYNNLTRVTVGEFTDRNAAETLKRKLHNAGYKDAFVRKTGYLNLETSKSDIEKFNILISELDAQAFYLDGHMYLFQGNGYIRIHRSIN